MYKEMELPDNESFLDSANEELLTSLREYILSRSPCSILLTSASPDDPEYQHRINIAKLEQELAQIEEYALSHLHMASTHQR